MERVWDGTHTPVLKSRSLPDLLASVLKAFAFEQDLTLIDADLTEAEQAVLQSDPSRINRRTLIPSFSRPVDYNQLIELVQQSKRAHLTLYSSGTTGQPKPVPHTLDTLAREVKQSQKHQSDVWGLTYSPTHMAGIQVLLQASFNGNRIINLRKLSREDIFSRIESERITHLSATPTFYRMLLPCDRVLNSVKRITFGGERFDPNLTPDILQMFPNAKALNVYASTEVGSLFHSLDNRFVVEERMASQVRIENQKLLIRKGLLGKIRHADEWYDTGDRVTVLSENPLAFTIDHRVKDIISVGGFKVNPHAVEDSLRACPGIRDARVFGERNSVVGTILRAEVERSSQDCTESEIRAHLVTHLQSYKIPRIIDFVEDLGRSRTGKAIR